jgi:autotransporter-associated beta strand protein
MNRIVTDVCASLKSVLEALRSFHTSPSVFAAAIAFGTAIWMPSVIEAATIIKANNSGNFNVGSSWVGSAVPASGDIARWDSTVTTGNTINGGGSGTPTLKGIQILNPAGPVAITYNTGGGNFWNIGSSGIDMSQATQDFSIQGLTLTASQTCTVATGRKLSLPNNFISMISMFGYTWTVNTVGTAVVSDSGKLQYNSSTLYAPAAQLIKQGAGTMILFGSNYIGGGITVTGGVLELSNTAGLSIPGGIAATGGTCNLILNGGIVGLANNNFARGLGTGLTAVQFTGSGGFAAFGADRTVNLGGASAGVTWASSSFVPNGSALVLSHTTADHMIDFQNPINFGGATQIVEVDDGSVATDAKLSGALTNGGLTKTGAGTLWLSASNNYALGININGGRVTILADSALGDVNGPVTFGAPATLSASGNVSMPATRSVTITTGTATFDTQGNQITIAGVISGSGALTKTGTSTLIVSNSNNYTGDTRVNSGTLQLNNGSALSGSTFDVSGSGKLNFGTQTAATFGGLQGAASGLLVLDNSLGGAVALTVGANDKSTTLFGSIAGDGSLTKVGSGSLTLAGSNSFVGTIAINAGVLGLSHSAALAGGGAISFGGGTLRYSASNTTDYSSRFITAASQNYSIDTNSQNITIAGNLTSSGGSLTKSGLGQLTLTGSNTYAGGTTINGGVLYFVNSSACPAAGPITINFSGALVASSGRYSLVNDWLQDASANQIDPNSAGAIALTSSSLDTSVDFTLGPGHNTLSLGAVGNVTYAGTITPGSNGYYLGGGGGTLTVASAVAGVNDLTIGSGGGGTVILTNSASNWSGTTTIAGGTLLIGDGATNTVAPTGPIVIAPGASLTLRNPSELDLSAGISGGGQLNAFGSGVLNLSGSNTVGSFYTAGGGTVNISGSFNTAGKTVFGSSTGSGSSVVNWSATGAMTPSPHDYVGVADGYAATLNVLGGSLAIANATDGFFVGNHATGTVQVSAGQLSVDASTPVYLGNIPNTAVPGNGFFSISGGLVTIATGSGAAASITMAAANDCTGVINLTGGTLVTGRSFVMGSGTGGTATLNLNGGVLQAAAANGNWIQGVNVIVGTGGATIDTQAFDMGIGTAVVIGGPGSLTKLGTSILTLSGSNTYAGKTIVKQGILRAASEASLGTVPTGYVADQITLDGGMLQNNNSSVVISANRGITLGAGGGLLRAGWSQPQGIVVNSTIAGVGPLTLANDSGTVSLANPANSYSGPTTFGNAANGFAKAVFVNLARLTNGGLSSSLGTSANSASNLLLDPGIDGSVTITYTGSGDNTDRLFTVASGSAAIINAAGSGPLCFTNTGSLVFSDVQSCLLTLGGTGPGVNLMTPSIADNGFNPVTLKVVAGMWLVAGTNSYVGGTTVAGGTLGLGSAAAVPGNITFTGGVLQHTASNTVDYSSTIVNSTAVMAIDTGGQSVTYGGSLASSNTAGLNKLGAGLLALNGVNSYMGTTTITSGTLQTGAVGALPALPLVITSGVLDLDGNGQSVGFLAAGAGAVITDNSSSPGTTRLAINQSTNQTYAGSIQDGPNHAVGLDVTAATAKTLTLTGSSNYSGGTTISGLAQVTILLATGLGSGSVTVGDFTGTNTPQVLLGNGVVFTNPLTITSGAGAGRGALQVPAGASATYNGTITLDGQNLCQLTSNGTMTVQGTISCSTSNTFGLRGSGTGFLASVLNIPTTKLTKTDASTWTISSTGNVWGNTTVAVGTLKLGANQALPATTVVVMGQGDANNATFDLNGFNQTVGGLGISTTGGTKLITDSSATPSMLTIVPVQDSTYGGTLGGLLSLSVNGAGAVTLSGSNPFTGTTSVSGGTLVVAHANALNNSTLTTNGVVFDSSLNSQTIILGGLSGSGDIALVDNNPSPQGVILSVGNNGASTTYSGALSGSGVLIKDGAGKLTLTGLNVYTGATIINSGVLEAIDGVGLPIASNLRFNGGVLQSSGSINRGLGVATDQVKWLPGASGGFAARGGKLTVSISGAASPLVWGATGSFLDTGSLVFGSSSSDNEVELTNNIDFNGAARTIVVNRGVGGDDAKLSGNLSGSGSSGLTKAGDGTLILSGSNTYVGNTWVQSGTLVVASPSALLDGSSLEIGANAVSLLGAAPVPAPIPELAGQTVAVPEPATWALLVAGGFFAVSVVRGRRRVSRGKTSVS